MKMMMTNARRWLTYRRWFPRWPRIGLLGYWGAPVTYQVSDHGVWRTETRYIRSVE